MESHARLQFHHSIRSAALSPTADLLAILNDQGLLSLHLFNGTSLWHTPLFLPTGVLPGGTNVSCRWSPDGCFILVDTGEVTLLFDRENGKQWQHSLPPSAGCVINLVRASHDGQPLLVLLTRASEREYSLWAHQGKSQTELMNLGDARVALLLDGYLAYSPFEGEGATTTTKVYKWRLRPESIPPPSLDVTAVMEETGHLSRILEESLLKLQAYGADNLIRMYVEGDSILFQEFTQKVLPNMGLRATEGRYQAAYTTAWRSLSATSPYGPNSSEGIVQTMRELLTEHRRRWDELLLFLKVTQQSGGKDVTSWTSSVSPTKLATIIKMVRMVRSEGGRMVPLSTRINQLFQRFPTAKVDLSKAIQIVHLHNLPGELVGLKPQSDDSLLLILRRAATPTRESAITLYTLDDNNDGPVSHDPSLPEEDNLLIIDANRHWSPSLGALIDSHTGETVLRPVPTAVVLDHSSGRQCLLVRSPAEDVCSLTILLST